MNHSEDVRVCEFKQGYTDNGDAWHCLFCDARYLKGDIYAFEGRLVEAGTAIRLHILEAHGSAFEVLIAEGKKRTGLTEIQSRLMTSFYQGLSAQDIAAQTHTAPSTVRYQRFSLREKARQARIFLALFELMEEKTKDQPKPKIHKGATMVDERYMTTEEETQRIKDTFFTSMNPLVLKTLSSREKKKIVILRVISGQFEEGKRYHENEVNEILKPIYGDFVTIRRYLIEYGFMKRTKDGTEYWRT